MQAYVLYLFLSLMLSYLNCEEDDYEVATYLETKLLKEDANGTNKSSQSTSTSSSISVGRAFLRSCKFGTLQYCLVRPLTALIAVVLDSFGLYEDANMSPDNSYLYLLIILNLSVAYAFISLASFYSKLKAKLYEFEPVGKFLCIKFVIFFAFWQSVFLTSAAKLDWITTNDSQTIQNLLICIEMVFVSVAHLYTFPVTPFAHDQNNTSNSIDGRPTFAPLPVYDDEEEFADHDARYSNQRPNRQLHYHKSATAHSNANPSSRFIHNPLGYRTVSRPVSTTTAADQTSYKPVTFDVETLSQHSSNTLASNETTTSNTRPRVTKVLANTLDRHFATNSAIRDFNEAMPVLTLPTGFTAHRGRVVRSDPASRLNSNTNSDNAGSSANADAK